MDHNDIIDDEDDMPAELRAVTEAINALMGGSAANYALEQLGDSTFAMVFNGEDLDLNEVVAQINEMSGVSARSISYPEGANLANVFGEDESGFAH